MTVIAIDGPGGAGKTSVATALADRLGAKRLDTGALYRAVTVAVLREDIDPADVDACNRIAATVEVDLTHDGRVLVDGEDVTREIRSDHVTAAVSVVSAHTGVRDVMREQQRRVASRGLWIVEGRDIGTVVFPDAALKVFLVAAVSERARRRAAETGRLDLAEVEGEISRRDTLDSSRSDSPLCPAADAVEVDTSELTLTEVADRIEALWHDRTRHDDPAS
ncbi:MAG: (d)CMP kinase [Acidimicrobiia bacterium]|nr:(d)CMP kinase [Acidimicrobiia bacterium]